MSTAQGRRREVDALRARVRAGFERAVAEADPAGAVAAVALRPGRRNLVVAAGKAAGAMAAGALATLGDADVFGVCVVPDGSPACPIGPLERMSAAHPVPDARSQAAARRALELARSLAAGDLLVALISGGASSLLAAPPPGVTLADKSALVRGLLEAGAPIRTVNLVRRRMSVIKDGRLARAAGAARVVTIVVSDVIGGTAADVGSGPTLVGSGSAEDCAQALERWIPHLASRWRPHLASPPETPARDVEVHVVDGPDAFAARVAAAFDGDLVATVGTGEEGDVYAAAARRVADAWRLASGHARVIPCEPTVTLGARRGRGGRAGLVALLAARDLPSDAVLLCGATDGVDGDSGAAGAVVTRAAMHRLPAGALDRAIAGHDDASIHRAAGTALDLGSTGLNMSDVHVVARL